MERLNWHMAEELSRFADVRVIGPFGSAALAPPSVTVREAPLRPLWSFLLQTWRLARGEARSWKPHIVLAGSGLTAPIARSAARLCGAETCVYVHGLDVAARHPAYRAIWLRAIRGMNCVVANSHATAELCRCSGVAPARITVVHPGVDLPAEAVGQSERESGSSLQLKPECGAPAAGTFPSGRAAQPRQKYRLGNRPLLLSVGRLSARKGLREFVSRAMPRIVAARPDAMLIVAGDAPTQALHAETQAPESIRAAADTAGVGLNVLVIGKVTDAELVDLYLSSNVHVFPIRYIPGDPEGFGMVAVEAAAHGLPSVAFATGGVVDAVAEGRSGRLIAAGDYDAFADAVLDTLANRETMRLSCVEFSREFAWPIFGGRMFRVLLGQNES